MISAFVKKDAVTGCKGDRPGSPNSHYVKCWPEGCHQRLHASLAVLAVLGEHCS